MNNKKVWHGLDALDRAQNRVLLGTYLHPDCQYGVPSHLPPVVEQLPVPAPEPEPKPNAFGWPLDTALDYIRDKKHKPSNTDYDSLTESLKELKL